MITRRSIVLAGALGALLPLSLRAQSRRVRIGILAPGKDGIVIPNLIQALAEHGYRDGVEADILLRSADDAVERYRPLAQELIDARCQVIFALGNDLPARALREVGTEIPIVFVAINYDPLEKGVVRSLSRPGANITGVYLPTPNTVVKRLELAKEILPQARRFLVLSDIFTKDQLAALRQAAASLDVDLTVIEYESAPYDYARGFEIGRKAGVGGVIVLTSRRLARESKQIALLAEAQRLPAFGPSVALPWLASYTIDGKLYTRMAADIAARILKGAKPADIPVVQPHVYEIVINLRRARELGIKVPQSVLLRATRVIE